MLVYLSCGLVLIAGIVKSIICFCVQSIYQSRFIVLLDISLFLAVVVLYFYRYYSYMFYLALMLVILSLFLYTLLASSSVLRVSTIEPLYLLESCRFSREVIQREVFIILRLSNLLNIRISYFISFIPSLELKSLIGILQITTKTYTTLSRAFLNIIDYLITSIRSRIKLALKSLFIVRTRFL